MAGTGARGRKNTGTGRGQRSARMKKKKKQELMKRRALMWALTCVFVVVLYAVICAVIGNRSMYAKTYINGIDVGGMKTAEAAETVGMRLSDKYKAATVNVSLNDSTYAVDVSGALSFDVEDEIQKIQDDSHRFWKRGYELLRSLVDSRSYKVYPAVQEEQIRTAVTDSEPGSMSMGGEMDGYKIEGEELVVIKGQGSYTVDADRLSELIAGNLSKGDYTSVVECPITSSDVDIDLIYEKLHTEAKEPSLDPDNNYEVTEGQDGLDFDLEGARALLAAAKDGEEVRIPLIYTRASMTTEEYKELLFRDEVSSYTTDVSGSDNRKANVALAAKACEDIIIMPGERFSFNEQVGETTKEKGYLPAPAYVSGKSVMGYGGGVCQISSTMYMAVLYANLQINERHSHPHPATYVPVGLDATVAYGSCDLVFTNNMEYPIKISMSYANGKASCVIRGTVTEKFKVELYAELIDTEPYETKYELDSALAEDEKKLETSGSNGTTYQSYRRVYDASGNVISDAPEAKSKYDRTDEVYKVGKLPDENQSTEAPATEAPATEVPTEAPATEAPTQAPTEAPTESTQAATEQPATTAAQ